MYRLENDFSSEKKLFSNKSYFPTEKYTFMKLS